MAQLVKNKQNTCTCSCGIAEVNAALTKELESKVFHPFSGPKKIAIKFVAE